MVDSTPTRNERPGVVDPGANYFIVSIRATATDLYIIRVNGAFLFESHSADNIKVTGAPGELRRKMKENSNIDFTACVLETLELQLKVKGVVESIVEHFSTFSRKSNRQLITIDVRIVILENKGCQGNCASRSKSCYGPQDTALYFRYIGFTKDTSALIMLKAMRDIEQSAYDNAKSLWPSLSKIVIPSLEIF
nr:protein MANNAN SYNTHESIS-RELATED 1-like [Nicotiana tomentosiformis]